MQINPAAFSILLNKICRNFYFKSLYMDIINCTSYYNGILVPVRTSVGLHLHGGKTCNALYQRKVDVDMLNGRKECVG